MCYGSSRSHETKFLQLYEISIDSNLAKGLVKQNLAYLNWKPNYGALIYCIMTAYLFLNSFILLCIVDIKPINTTGKIRQLFEYGSTAFGRMRLAVKEKKLFHQES